MDAAALSRVRFLVRPDAWAVWDALGMPPETLDMAQAEYGDLRLVATYVLETVCGVMRQSAAENAADGLTKSYEVVGEWKEEFFGPPESAESLNAADWCARAQMLRDEVSRARRQGGLRSVSVPVEVEP